MISSTATPFTLILIRHGQTDWNAEERYQGQLDIPLNNHGQNQTKTLPVGLDKCLLEYGIAAAKHIYSSDLVRAFDTARPLAQSLKLPIVQSARLRERHFGILGGLTRAEMAQKHPEAFMQLTTRVPDAPLEQGESLRAFHHRVVAFVTDLLAAHANQTIICVTHGGVIDCIYRMVNGVDLSSKREWALHNCGINIVQHKANEPHHSAWHTKLWGYTQHLDDTPNTLKAHHATHTAL